MRRTTTIIIGAGHAGLAMSRCLSERGIDHVVLERGEIGNSWRTERWDSLRLLTPNWQQRLPGLKDRVSDPDGFACLNEVIGLIDRYARVVSAPVRTHTRVVSVRAAEEGYAVCTDQGNWFCRSVVVASGACNIASVPGTAASLPGTIQTLTAQSYRNPSQIDEGGVLVVGASASGIQIAHELQASGRQVTIAVGEHIRAPRRYRGQDVLWWMDVAGLLDQRYDDIDDIVRARQVPSLQLTGCYEYEILDLNVLHTMGVRVVGRLAGVADTTLHFSGSLRNQCMLSDLKMARLLDAIDQWASDNGIADRFEPPHRFASTTPDCDPPLKLDTTRDNIRTVIWSTGYRPDYSWLHIPVFDRKGRIVHDGGVVGAPGVYVMGLPFLRRRKSSFIDGAGDDARDLSAHLDGYLSSDGNAVIPLSRRANAKLVANAL